MSKRSNDAASGPVQKSKVAKKECTLEDISAKLDGLTEKVEKVDKGLDTLTKSVDTLTESVDTLTESVDTLVACTPAAAIGALKLEQHLVEASSPSWENDVLPGGASTWTYLSHPTNPTKLIAVGSVHCGLYHGTFNENMCFVNLPKDVLDLGVERIGFLDPKQLANPISPKQDVMVVELRKSKKSDPRYVYQPFDPNTKIRHVVGLSQSGIVTAGGNGHLQENHGALVFVQDAGEPGNSGTLMFGWMTDIKDAKPIGVYFGTFDPSSSSNLRTRGQIGPLHPYGAFEWFSPLSSNSMPSTLGVVDQNGIHNCRLTGIPGWCELEDGNEKWFGVLLDVQHMDGGRINYVGSFDSGSARCN